MWRLAAIANQIPDGPRPRIDPLTLWYAMVVQVIASILTIPYAAFWIWMLVHCYRTEPDRQSWLWILIIAHPIGPIAYFILRYLPSKEFTAPAFLRRWTRGAELGRLESAAYQIGNPHQFVQWGDALREVGRLDQACDAYGEALKKDPENVQALWGSALVAGKQKRYADVRSLTRRVLDKDPHYKFGDVSLAYARALNELGEFEAARSHLDQHLRRWRHPEGVFLLARLCESQGATELARDHLQALVRDINGSPAAIARKHGRWKSRAQNLLRKLSR
jgi:hypothetical protein